MIVNDTVKKHLSNKHNLTVDDPKCVWNNSLVHVLSNYKTEGFFIVHRTLDIEHHTNE